VSPDVVNQSIGAISLLNNEGNRSKSAVRPRAVLAKEVWLDRNVVRRLQATMSSFRHIRLEKCSQTYGAVIGKKQDKAGHWRKAKVPDYANDQRHAGFISGFSSCKCT
jgi:hypothetical protein